MNSERTDRLLSLSFLVLLIVLIFFVVLDNEQDKRALLTQETYLEATATPSGFSFPFSGDYEFIDNGPESWYVYFPILINERKSQSI